MRLRRLPRRLDQRLFARAAQLIRLERIAAGRLAPRGPREMIFLDLHRLGRRPDPRDFILSWPLLRLELEWLRAEQDLTGSEDDPADLIETDRC